jgi:amidase
MDELALRSATQLEAAIRDGSVSSRELLELYLQRVDQLNPSLNAVVTLDTDRALAAAKRADDRTAAGDELGPLHGLPVTIKDAIETAGIRSTGGARELAEHVPAADAPAVVRLRAAGAIVYGKTNVPKWSGNIQTYNDLFGVPNTAIRSTTPTNGLLVTNNPWDVTRTSGGSSGGPAVAVAAGLTSFELGTDIGGSIRIPSSYCGVFGHKPSFGIVSQRGYLDRVDGGVIDADINVFGPIARSAEDLDLLLGVLAGPDAEDATGWRLDLPGPRHADLSGYRVGLWLDDPAAEVDTEIVAALAAAADALSTAGAQVKDARPDVSMSDAVRLFHSLLLPAVAGSADPEIGDELSGPHLRWLFLHQKRQLMRRQWADWFTDYDTLLCPVTPMVAFPHDHHGTIADRVVTINGQARNQVDSLAWTGLIGVVYLPSTVVPVGRTKDGLPIGVQVVGPYLEDRTALFLAARLAELTGGYEPPPIALP